MSECISPAGAACYIVPCLIISIVLYTVAATALRGTPAALRMLNAAHTFTGLWVAPPLTVCYASICGR